MHAYANSVLQALYFCGPFRELLLQSPDPSLSLPQKYSPATTAPPSPVQPASSAARRKPERKQTTETVPTLGTNLNPGFQIPASPPTLLSALRSLFLHIAKNPLDKGQVAPRAFIEKLKEVNIEFRNTNQQDAHEFLNFLLNKIVEEIMEDRKNQPASLSREDFGTLLSATVATATTSSNSGTAPQDATLVSSRDESFLDLSIDIEQNSSVTACLRQFSAKEQILLRLVLRPTRGRKTTVEPIKESEISKYFGDSNSGSAYVLYYQAVDLDMAALGLRPSTPTTPAEHLIVPKRASWEPPASPLLAPSLPPGLVDSSDTQDLTDSPMPYTPTQSSPVTPFLERSPLKSPSLQPLTVKVSGPDLPSHSLDQSPPSSPVHSTSSKLFGLRHSPSVRARGGSTSTSNATVEKRRSIRDKFTPGRPSTSQGLPHADEGPPPEVPPLALAPPLPVSDTEETEKAKEAPARKPSMWFKLKSGKRPGTATGAPSSPQLGTVFPPPPAMSRFPPTASAPEVSDGRRPSEPAVGETGNPVTSSFSLSKRSHMPKRSLDLSMTSMNGGSNHNHGHETHSTGSATSSFASSSAQAEMASTIPSLPPIPASPPGPTINQPIYNNEPPTTWKARHSTIEHQRSQPQLHNRKASLADFPPSPTRPKTGESTTATFPRARTLESDPVPPLPTFTHSNRRRVSNDQASDTTGTSTSDGGRPASTGDNLDLPVDTPPPPPKRTSRKLSLSAPMLGFGRKDKKDKDKTPAYEKVSDRNAKEKEKEAKAQAKEREKEEKDRRKQDARRRQEESLAHSPSTPPSFTVMARF
ncbi:hypothetical protein HWV62_20906 [Athelia sp. TMB]|nr:hypothetical protein HWV62_20906 [Athelia sp. TMB]